MGNTQGNQNDNRNVSEKQRKSSTVRERVLARFKSRSSLPIKDNTDVAPCTAANHNEFTDTQTITRRDDVREAADIQPFEKVGNVDNRISQISQGAESATDALDFGKFKIGVIHVYYCFVYELILRMIANC